MLLVVDAHALHIQTIVQNCALQRRNDAVRLEFLFKLTDTLLSID